uniref:MBL fold metallo-hydrolase n=1 Tax=Eubacterium cellulosolvens TaxID=29322 RepID=UPI00048868E9|nr:MBL fold metallo-hydrolase [[Eubacterium] cellulosolvens]
MRLTIVVDNISSEGMEGEWGLAILAEHGDKKILVDTGASDLFLKNMEAMGIDVKDIDYGVLSHAHYDHANGLPAFFKNNARAKFYLRDGAAENCYKKGFFILKKYIGIPRRLLKNYPDRIEMVSGDYRLTDGAYLIPHKTAGLCEIGKREQMYQRTKRGWVYDDFCHEQSLVLDTEKGLVIINSCSHGGAVNIINEVKETFPDHHVYALIGGFHLFNKSDEEVREVAAKIRETGIDYVCTGHCTKGHAYRIMKEELGDMIDQMRVGYRIEI